VNNRSYWY